MTEEVTGKGSEEAGADAATVETSGEVNPLLRDPAANTEHLTPSGKRKRRSIDKRAQNARFDAMIQDRANEVIPKDITATPGDNLKPKTRKIIGIDD